jgi:hypothetical protein
MLLDMATDIADNLGCRGVEVGVALGESPRPPEQMSPLPAAPNSDSNTRGPGTARKRASILRVVAIANRMLQARERRQALHERL